MFHVARRFFLYSILALIGVAAPGQTYYVSPTGDDVNPGSIDSSFKTIPKAISLAVPGTTIYVRQGTYPIAAVIAISSSGTVADTCRLLAYPGERAVIDGSPMPVGGNNRGFSLSGSYWHIRGLDIVRAGDNGMRITGSHNVIENCSFSGNSDTGLQIDNGASFNQIINCDSYGNADPQQGNADGFETETPDAVVGRGTPPGSYTLWQNHPNPFNLSTTIRYELSRSSHVRIALYDVLGREISVLVDAREEAGRHDVGFDGAGLSSGMYFYRLLARPTEGREAGYFVQTKTLLLLK